MKKFTIIFSLLAFFLLSISSLMSQHLSKFEKWQHPTYFKGFCISDWNNFHESYVNQSEFNQLKATGANLVIIQTGGIKAVESPYGPGIWYSEDGYTIYWQDVLDDMVSFARNVNLQYVISVRSGPGRIDVAEDEGGTTVWTNDNEQQLYGEMLRDMASRYLPDTLFVGLDLTVEPNPYGEMAGESVEDLADALSSDGINVNEIYTLWINTVRTVAPNLPLMVQGVHWSNPAYFSLVEKQADNKIIYKPHCYNPFDFSHAEDPLSETYPGLFWSDATQNMETFNKSFLKESVYATVRAFEQTHNVPIIIGEFGLNLHQQGGDQYLSDIMSIAEEFGWHYSLWNWNNTETFNYPHFDQTHNTFYMDMISEYFSHSATKVENSEHEKLTTKKFRLLQNYPNPFNPETIIQYELAQSSFVEIAVYNLQGELISQLIRKNQTAGSYQLQWNGRNLKNLPVSSGVYVYRIKVGEFVSAKKMTLLR